jgi:hypothetical protein
MARSNLKAVEDQANMMNNDDDLDSIIEYSVNLADVGPPPVLPIGDYTAEITGFEKKFGKDSGRPYFNVKWTVRPDNQPADFVEALGTQGDINMYQMVFGATDDPVSWFNMKQFCEAARVPLSNRIDPNEFLNKEARVTVRHGKDLSGNPRPEVAKVNKA